jgi:TRAP-type mannitol/chloroaromatic compound transport system permease small subunit
LLGILFFGLIVWGSYEPTLHAWASGEYEGEGALRVPVWPARVAVIVGSGLVVVSYALLAVHAVCSLVTGLPDAEKPAASTHL